MPQFDLSNFAPQLAWLALFFAILYFAIVRPTLPKLDRVTGERERRVGSDLAAAEAAKAQADATRETYEREIAAAHGDGQESIAAAKTGAAHALETRLKALGEELDTRAEAAGAKLAAAREASIAELNRVAAEAAGEIVTRLTGKAPAPDRLAGAVAQQG